MFSDPLNHERMIRVFLKVCGREIIPPSHGAGGRSETVPLNKEIEIFICRVKLDCRVNLFILGFPFEVTELI